MRTCDHMWASIDLDVAAAPPVDHQCALGQGHAGLCRCHCGQAAPPDLISAVTGKAPGDMHLVACAMQAEMLGDDLGDVVGDLDAEDDADRMFGREARLFVAAFGALVARAGGATA